MIFKIKVFLHQWLRSLRWLIWRKDFAPKPLAGIQLLLYHSNRSFGIFPAHGAIGDDSDIITIISYATFLEPQGTWHGLSRLFAGRGSGTHPACLYAGAMVPCSRIPS